jgi:hypothetical protein
VQLTGSRPIHGYALAGNQAGTTDIVRYRSRALGVNVAKTNLFRVTNHTATAQCFSRSRRIKLPEPDMPRVWRALHPPPLWSAAPWS